jgi:hypothetical protein
MKIHLPWIRVTAAAVLVAGVGVQPAAAQYAPYRPIPQQPAAPAAVQPAPAAPAAAATSAAPAQYPYAATTYTAYRTQPAAPPSPYASTAQPTPAYSTAPQPALATGYGLPTGSQYTQPTAAYPQYPQTANQYPGYSAYPRLAQQPTTEPMPAPSNLPAPSKSMSTSAAQPSNGTMAPTRANGIPAGDATTMSAAQPGSCGCNACTYGAGDYYTAPGCGCGASGGYPNCNINQYFTDNDCGDNQWFGGIYFLEMGRTNATPVKLTSQIPTGSTYPYYPTPNDTILTNRDADFNFREGVEFRFGSTFTIGESSSACQSPCGYNMNGCGCNSCCPPTIYAWEVAWWGINDSPESQTVVYTTERFVGMKNYAGLQYNGNPVNGYYGYGLPVPAGPADPQILAQRVRTDFKAQNLELNIIRFPMCNTCSTGSCGCNGSDACGCNSCGDNCGCGFSMYGSCGVRYFRLDDDFLYGTEFNPGGAHAVYDGFGSGDAYELFHDIQVENNLVGPQVGWTSDYCCGRWNFFLNSTFGIFNNHMSVWQRMYDGAGTSATFSDGSTYNIRENKNAVAFLGELRAGTAYDFSCHWRGVLAYRAVALTGVATADAQLHDAYSDRWTAGLIDSDNSVVIHGVQIGAECRY